MKTSTAILLLAFTAICTSAYALTAEPAHGHGTIAPNIPYHHMWTNIGMCESGMRQNAHGPRGGDTYHARLQWANSTWASVNSSRYTSPHQAPAWVEFVNANKLRSRGASTWPHCWAERWG